jgi:hypothetical protein
MGIETLTTPLEEIVATHKQLAGILEDMPDNKVLSNDDIKDFDLKLKKMMFTAKSDSDLKDLEHKYDTVLGMLKLSPVGDIKAALNQILDKESF